MSAEAEAGVIRLYDVEAIDPTIPEHAEKIGIVVREEILISDCP